MLTDSITATMETLREYIAAMPPEQRQMAKGACVHIEKALTDLQRSHPKNKAVAIGAAFAIFMIAERMVDNTTEDSTKGLIKLIN